MHADHILDKLLVGACPTRREDIDDLRQTFGVTAVLNLQTDDDFVYWNIDWPSLEACYRDAGIEVRRVPVQDFSREALRMKLPECVRALDQLLAAGHTVLVHCSAGINRSPSTVIAYLHWIERWDLDRAVQHVLNCRVCDPYLESIRAATEDWMKQSEGEEKGSELFPAGE